MDVEFDFHDCVAGPDVRRGDRAATDGSRGVCAGTREEFGAVHAEHQRAVGAVLGVELAAVRSDGGARDVIVESAVRRGVGALERAER
jgi:hypothetical protein